MCIKVYVARIFLPSLLQYICVEFCKNSRKNSWFTLSRSHTVYSFKALESIQVAPFPSFKPLIKKMNTLKKLSTHYNDGLYWVKKPPHYSKHQTDQSVSITSGD